MNYNNGRFPWLLALFTICLFIFYHVSFISPIRSIAQQTYQTVQTIMNDVWDPANHQLKTVVAQGGGGGSPITFGSITSGTNTAATMIVGDGAGLSVTGTGTIAATSVPSTGVTGTMSDAQIPDLTTLSSGLTTSRCVRTDPTTGKLIASSTDCAVASVWGNITGTLSNQTDLNTALSAKALSATTLTINGTANEISCSGGSMDLTANRTWTCSFVNAINIAAKSLLTPSSGSLPGTCTVGQVYFLTSASPAGRNWYGCTTTNTWTLLGDGNVPPQGAVQLTDAATLTPNLDTTSLAFTTSLSQATNIANATGTPTDGQILRIRLVSSTTRALTWGNMYTANMGIALPTATTGSNTYDQFGFQWNAATSKLDLIATTQPQ